MFKSEYILTEIWQTISWRNAEQKSWRTHRIAWFVQNDTARASKERLFLTWIRLQIVYLLIASKTANFSQWLSELATLKRKIDDDLHSWQQQSCSDILRKKKTFQNDDKTEKTKKKDLIYVFKAKITFLFISFYELRYLLINDIMRSISRWQQSAIKQKALTATAERRIRYSIFITRHSTQTKSFEQQTHVSN
jgi:hypothetical protein